MEFALNAQKNVFQAQICLVTIEEEISTKTISIHDHYHDRISDFISMDIVTSARLFTHGYKVKPVNEVTRVFLKEMKVSWRWERKKDPVCNFMDRA